MIPTVPTIQATHTRATATGTPEEDGPIEVATSTAMNLVTAVADMHDMALLITVEKHVRKTAAATAATESAMTTMIAVGTAHGISRAVAPPTMDTTTKDHIAPVRAGHTTR